MVSQLQQAAEGNSPGPSWYDGCSQHQPHAPSVHVPLVLLHLLRGGIAVALDMNCACSRHNEHPFHDPQPLTRTYVVSCYML